MSKMFPTPITAQITYEGIASAAGGLSRARIAMSKVTNEVDLINYQEFPPVPMTVMGLQVTRACKLAGDLETGRRTHSQRGQ